MKFIEKCKRYQIEPKDIDIKLPELKNIKESKSIAIAKWLIEFIKTGHNAKPEMLLPSKPELAYMTGVSIGTIQNALRYIEDLGYITSKQSIGTMISNNNNEVRKLTSKREIAVNLIKKYINDNNIQPQTMLPSSRIISSAINCSANTTRLALETLAANNILEHKFKNGEETKRKNKIGWILKTTDFNIEPMQNETNTLVKKIAKDIKDFISTNLKIGDRIPQHGILAKKYSASLKTTHDAIKILTDEGILLPKRGKYGTTVVKMPYDKNLSIKKETSIFAPAAQTAFYYYEKTQNHIKKMIADNYVIGQKLPSIKEISKLMELSPNTIRKALNNLAKEGYLTFARGRYGGTFVIDIPETEEQSFKWLAVNPQYANIYKN